MGEHLGRLAEQVAKGVDEVNARLIDEEPRVIAEEGLATEIGPLSPSIAQAHEKVHVRELANRACHLNRLGRAVPRLPSPVLVDHEPHARRSRTVHDPAARLQRGCQGLLTDDVDSAPGSFGTHLFVRVGRRDDVDEVRALAIEHLPPVGVVARHA